MYTDITSVAYDSTTNVALVTGIDLDSVLLNDWDQEFADQHAEVQFRFDLTGRGPRIYLYRVIKSLVKEPYASMEEALMKLPGKITNISSNFIMKDEH